MTASIPDAWVHDKVVELRVHGVSGTKPEFILGDPNPVQVAGDEAGRIFRRTSPITEPFKGRSRLVEAFHWGQFTAGSPTRALWLLLVPFALLNLARFAMLMPHRGDPRGRDAFAQAVLRLLGLALTLTLTGTACFIGWDVGVPGGVGDAAKRPPEEGGWQQGHGGYGLILGAGVPALVITLMWWLGRQSFIHDPPGEALSWGSPNGSFDDVGFWRGSPTSSWQRAAHVLAALGLVGLLALANSHSPLWPPRPGTLSGWLHVGLPVGIHVGLVVVNLLLLLGGMCLVIRNRVPKEPEVRSDRLDVVALPARLRKVRRWVGVPTALASVAFAAWATDHHHGTTQGRSPDDEAVSLLVALTAVLLLMFCVANTVLTRDRVGKRLRNGNPGDQSYPPVPAAFRPFWFGQAASMISALAVTLAFGLSTAAVFWAAGVRGNIDSLPSLYRLWAGILGVIAVLVVAVSVPVAALMLGQRWHVMLWWAAPLLVAWLVWDKDPTKARVDGWDSLYLVALLIAGVVAYWMLVHHVRGAPAAQVAEDYPGVADDPGGLVAPLLRLASLRRLWVLAETRTRYHYAVGTLAVLGALGTVTAGVLGLFQPWALAHVSLVKDAVQSGPSPVGALGVTLVSALATGLVALGIATWRTPARRSTVGIIWDLLSFWPRSAHPLCPPPYGGRAVLGVATRAVQLAETRDQRGLGASVVVLSGHSQGSLISAAAIAVLDFQGWPTEPRPPSPETWLSPKRARAVLPRLALVGYGSQLQFIYARMFPTYFGFGRMAWLYTHALRRLSGDDERLSEDPLPRWRNLYRWSDPIGGPVLTWPSGSPPPRPGPEVNSWLWPQCDPQASCSGHRPIHRVWDLDDVPRVSYRIGPDIRLVDPAVVIDSAHAPRLPPLRHSDYPVDPVFNAVVASLAEQTRKGSEGSPRG